MKHHLARLVAFVAATGLAAAVGSSVAGAADGQATVESADVGTHVDLATGMQVLDLLCVEADGTVYFSPYAITRCEGARARQSLEVEQLVCEGLLAGTLTSNGAIGRPHRVNWACVPGAVI